MIGGELVVVEVVAGRIVFAAHIHHGDRHVIEILLCWLAAFDGHAVHGDEQAAREEFVLMRAAGVGEDQGSGHPDAEP